MYFEFPVTSPLVLCTWERTVRASQATRVLPDGCVDLVFIDGHGLQIAGPDTTAKLSSIGRQATVSGVRMRPGAGGGVLGLPADALRDVRVPLAELWGERAARLEEALAAAPPSRRRALLLAAVDGAPDPLVLAAARELPERQPGDLADLLGCSERTLRRRFHAAVGYGPKTLQRVLRLQRVLTAMDAGEDLARIAADGGWADQPHFTADVADLTGLTPAALVAERSSRAGD